MFSLYGDLPAPKTKNESDSNNTTNTNTQNAPSSEASITTSTSGKPVAGWSNTQQFRPVMRKPVIQAKPKLVKPFIPTGAKLVSTTTVNKELESSTINISTTQDSNMKENNIKPVATIAPLNTKAFISTVDDVNGFRQNKKKNKQNKQLQNQGPPPIDLYEDYDPQKPTDYEQYKEEMEIIKQSKKLQRRDSYSSDEYSRSRSRSRSRSPSPRRPTRGYAPPPELYSNSKSFNRHDDYSRHRSPSDSPPYRRESRSPSPPPSIKRMDLQESADDAYNRRAMLSQQTGDDAYNRRAMLSQQQQQQQQKPMDTSNTKSNENAAWKMMNKYGWQEGQGLGRSEDGIREALQVQARGDGSGVILPQKQNSTNNNNNNNNNKDNDNSNNNNNINKNNNINININKNNASKVILLKNMVGVGEVDDSLQQETADECSKYGTVEQCLIQEIPGGQVSDEEAVRIFVKFSTIQSAAKAIDDLNGRYFGGRVVSAEFYDQTRFDKLDLSI